MSDDIKQVGVQFGTPEIKHHGTTFGTETLSDEITVNADTAAEAKARQQQAETGERMWLERHPETPQDDPLAAPGPEMPHAQQAGNDLYDDLFVIDATRIGDQGKWSDEQVDDVERMIAVRFQQAVDRCLRDARAATDAAHREEVRRLKDECEHAHDNVQDFLGEVLSRDAEAQQLHAQVARLTEERETLRKALEELIEALDSQLHEDDDPEDCEICRIVRRASAALTTTQEPTRP